MISGSVRGLNKLRDANRRLERSTKAASKRRVREGTNALKRQARRDVRQVFAKNNKIANAVRARHYDNRGRGDAGLIYDKFGRRRGGRFVSNLQPYLTGRPIRPRAGRFLAIWRGRGRRRRPSDFRNLVSIRTRGGIWLVRQTRTRTTFLFQLIRVARRRRRLHPERWLRRVRRNFGRNVQQDIERAV